MTDSGELAGSTAAKTGARPPRLSALLVPLVLLAASALLLATAPMGGDFWWSDAPRHALNGAFVKDLVAAFPIHDPRGWAVDYYLQYPSLSILFYPPLFYAVEAVMFAVLGVTHFAAQATVTLFIVLLAFSAYGVARFFLPKWSALGFALLIVGAPETAFWARQVMLDIPTYAAAVTGLYFFVRLLRQGRNRDLYFAALAFLAAVYIKLNTIFLLPVLLVVFIRAKGLKGLRARDTLIAAALTLLGLIPILLLTAKFGTQNIQSVVGRPDDLPLTSAGAWLFYAAQMPQYLGWVILALAVLGLGLIAFKRPRGTDEWFVWLLIGWLGFGYLFFSAIGVRETRHGLMLTFPLALCAVLALHRLLPARLAQGAALLAGAATFGYSLIFVPAPTVTGYREVADYVALHAPKDAIVVFSGYRDGNFVFNMRTHEERRDVTTLRADKLLLRIAVERERGVGQANDDEAEIAAKLRQFGAALIIYQPGFWEDLREMARFSAVVHSRDFEKVASSTIGGTGWHADRQIEIYRATYPIVPNRTSLKLDMPIIGDTFEGTTGK